MSSIKNVYLSGIVSSSIVKKSCLLSSVFVAQLTSFAAIEPALAQEEDTIIVTATKRETAIQDTPIALSAFSAEQLSKAGANDLRDIDLYTPGLFISGNAGFAGSNGVSIRGIGSTLLGAGSDEGVGIYIDGIYQGRTTSSIFEFSDIERIEVLRGPQATLYGRNATGGAINIITMTPGDELSGRFEVEGARYKGIGVRGHISAPIIEGKLAAKVSGAIYEQNGYQQNPVREEDLNGTNNRFFSGALHWTPAENWDVTIRGYFGETNIPVAFKDIADGLSQDVIPADFENSDERKFSAVSGVIEHELPFATLTALAGYTQTSFATLLDSDGGPIDNVRFDEVGSFDQFTAEVRLASSGEKRINWLLGAFFFKEEGVERAGFNIFRSPVPGFEAVTGAPFGLLFAADVETKAVAGFGEIIINPIDRVTLTGGLRYSYEEKDWGGCIGSFTLLEVDFDRSACDALLVPDQADWDVLTPRAVIDFKAADNVLLYASATKGFRAGGWNFTEPVIPGAENGFEPENVWSYEVGAKTQLWNNRATVNVAGFYADYTDLQVRVLSPTGVTNVKNAGTAEIKGVELEVASNPVDALQLSGTLTWLNAEYEEFSFTSPTGVVDFAGNRLNRAPEWQSSITAAYQIPAGANGTLVPRVSWQYTSEMFHDETNTQPKGSEEFHIVDLRLRYENSANGWGFEVFAENVTNARYREHTFQGILPTIFPSLISPPTIFGGKVFVRW